MGERVTICLCGGGAQSHVIGAWLSSKGVSVSILTRQPNKWIKSYKVQTPNGEIYANIAKISNSPAQVIPDSKIILLTVPGYANRDEINKIKPYLNPGSYVGSVFCSSGFFFEALKLLPENIHLWGFQRVPYIARVTEYGHNARLQSFRLQFKIAVERASTYEKEFLRQWIAQNLGSETILLNNHLEASITNSNPILHTARLYSMFKDWSPGKFYSHHILFYEEWTEEAAELLIRMDGELFDILAHLPVSPNYITPLLEYYESHDAKSLAKKISSITGFKGITSPMKQMEGGWIPDFASRYFTEDFGYSLSYIHRLAMENGVAVPNISEVLDWGQKRILSNI